MRISDWSSDVCSSDLRFAGYRGTARRPRADESAAPRTAGIVPDSLRQLVHELRTPTSAIAGFAEMIEAEILGPVDDPYRDRAAASPRPARDLPDPLRDHHTRDRTVSQEPHPTRQHAG